MKLTEKHSELIRSMIYDTTNNTLTIEYRADGERFRYFKVSEATYRALVRSRHPGEDWLKIRMQYRYAEV